MQPTAVTTLVAGALAVCLGALLPSAPATAAEAPAIPFVAAVGDRFVYAVTTTKAGSFRDDPAPAVGMSYTLTLAITEARANGYTATVTNDFALFTVDGKPVKNPPDFDSLVVAAVSGIDATVELSAAGMPVRVVGFEGIRDQIVGRAEEIAGENGLLRNAVTIFLPQVRDSDAIYMLARPLVLSATARTVAIEPGKTMVQIDGARLPSFFPALTLDWVFAPLPAKPGETAREWSAAPDPEALGAILKPVLDQLLAASPDVDAIRKAVAEDSNASQYFKATYDKNGRVVDFGARNELRAGPVRRQLEIRMTPG